MHHKVFREKRIPKDPSHECHVLRVKRETTIAIRVDPQNESVPVVLPKDASHLRESIITPEPTEDDALEVDKT